MNKQIIVLCATGQQFGLVIDEDTVADAMSAMIEDLKDQEFICLTDYATIKAVGKEMWIRSSLVSAVFATEISNIQVPNKNLVFPGGIRN